MAYPLLPGAPTYSPARAQPLRLVVSFKAAGWRYPFCEGDGVEVWLGQTHRGTLPAVLLFQVVRHYLQGTLIQEEVSRALHPEPEPLPRLRATNGRLLRRRPGRRGRRP